MKIQRSTLLRRQWNELLAGWSTDASSPTEFQSVLQKHQLAFDLPIGVLAGAGIERAEGRFVQCGVVSLQERACMLIEVGRSGRATHMDSIGLKSILRAQDISISSGLPIAYVWLGQCDLGDDGREIFPDLDAAGNILVKAGQANMKKIEQFTYSETSAGIGGLVSAAVAESAGFATEAVHGSAGIGIPGSHFIAWLGRQRPLPRTTGSDFLLQRDPAESESSFASSYSQNGESVSVERLDLTDIMPLNPSEEYDTRDVIAALVDKNGFLEYRGEFGRTLLCGYASINGLPFGIVANQRRHIREPGRAFEFGGVIYAESADKGARFILDCNQNRLPIVFIQDVNGFMVGREAEIAGIIRSGAKMVNAVANSVVPKITLIIGGSYGAGNYALCGKGYDPLFIFGWPTARYAVMGGDQAARTLSQLQIRQAEASGTPLSEQERTDLLDRVKQTYEEQLDPRYAAARLWMDHIIFPGDTRSVLSRALQIAHYTPVRAPLKTGVIQT